jgi:hypothetical protein
VPRMRKTPLLLFIAASGIAMAAAILSAGPAAAQQTPTATPTSQVPAGTTCAVEEIQLSAYEETRVGEVTIEIAAAVSRSCRIGSIAASLIDSNGKLVPNAAEARAATELDLAPLGDRVIGTVVWRNWCGEDPWRRRSPTA